MKTRVETTIDRPVDEVFAFVADPTNDPQWCPSVTSVRQVSGDGPAEGARYAVVHEPMGKPVDLEYEILDVEPPRHLRMRQDDDLATFLTTYTLEPAGSGRAHLVQASELHFKGFARVAAPIIRRFVLKGNREQFDRLRALLEGRQPAGGEQEPR